MALPAGAMRVPSPAAGMMTTTFMAVDKYTFMRELSSNPGGHRQRTTAQNTFTLKVRYFLGSSRMDLTSWRVSISIWSALL